MKLITHATTILSVTATAFAGSPNEVVAPASAPAPVSLGGWFVGGTFGQFDTDSNLSDLLLEGAPLLPGESLDVDDAEFDMYTLHVGRDLGEVVGCDMAAYLEVGYLNGDMDINGVQQIFNSGPPTFENFSEEVDLDIIPVTINFKLERALFGPVSGYITAGAGYAFTRASVDGDSDRDGGFYAHGSFGLIYNINESCEVYGGGRWLYLDNLDFGGDGFELDNALAWEVGFRYNF